MARPSGIRPSELRLFLLKTVLFPRQEIQLVVFEPRYHELLRACLEAGEPFGVALIREGPEVGGTAVPYSVGTTALIQHARPLPDGRVALEVRGDARFRIVATHDDRAYPWADVEYPADADASTLLPIEVERIRDAYRQVVRLRQAGAGEYERNIEAPADPAALADAVGALKLGSSPQRQRILEPDDPRTRLTRAGELLARALEGVQRQSQRAVAERVRGPRLN